MMLASDEEVYGKYAGELIRFAALVVGPHEAADAVSSGVISALQSTGWATVRNPRAYLYRAVLNEARMMIRRDARRRKYEVRVAPVESAVTMPTPRPEIATALARLSPKQRAVIHLTYWEDLDPRTVGELLGISDGTVRRHLARARTTLRKVLDA